MNVSPASLSRNDFLAILKREGGDQHPLDSQTPYHVLCERVPGEDLASMGRAAPRLATGYYNRARRARWATAGLVFSAGVSTFGLLNTSLPGALGLGSALALSAGLSYLYARRCDKVGLEYTTAAIHMHFWEQKLAPRMGEITARSEIERLASAPAGAAVEQQGQLVLVGGVPLQRRDTEGP